MYKLLAILCLLTSCKTAPPNIPICIEMSLSRGECIKIISGEKFTIDSNQKFNGKTYWEIRPTNLVLPMESWVDLKKFIIKLCKKNKNMCEKEVSTWERNIETIDKQIEKKGE